LRSLLGDTKLDFQRNVDIRELLKVQTFLEDIQTYQKNWKGHVERMQDERTPKVALKYQPAGKRSRGRPRKDGKISSWNRGEEYLINKASQQFKTKNFSDSGENYVLR
jgi:hypothetical protein